MTLGTDSGALRDVAVGATREEAASTFGEYFDDAFFTSYDDFDAEVDVSLLRTLGLVAGDGLTAVLPRVLSRHNEPGGATPSIVVGLTPDVHHRDVVGQLLATHPSVSFSRVLHSGGSVLLPLESTEGPGDTGPALEVLASSPAPPPPAAPPTDPAAVRAPEAAPREVAPSGLRDRRRLALTLAVVLAVVAAVVLVSIGLALGADALVVAVLVCVVASQCVVVLGLAYVVRLVRELGRDRGDEELFRRELRRRSRRLVRLAENNLRLQRDDLAAGQKARNEVAVVRNRVTALGRLLGRSEASARDANRQVNADPNRDAD
jgi:hypothetical protein